MGDRKKLQIWTETLTKQADDETDERANHVAPGNGDGDFPSANENQNSLPSSRAALGSQRPEPDPSHRPRDDGNSSTNEEQRSHQSFGIPRGDGHTTNHEGQRLIFSQLFTFPPPLDAQQQENSANVNMGCKQQDSISRSDTQILWPQNSSALGNSTWGVGEAGGQHFPHDIWIPVGRNQPVVSNHGQHSHALPSNPHMAPNTSSHMDRSQIPRPYQAVYNDTCGNNASSNFHEAYLNQMISFLPSALKTILNLYPNLHHHHPFPGYNVSPSVFQPTIGWPYQDMMVDPLLAQNFSNPTHFQYGYNMPCSNFGNPWVMTTNYLNDFATSQARKLYHFLQLAAILQAVHQNVVQTFSAPQVPTNQPNHTCATQPVYDAVVRETPWCVNHLPGDGNPTSQYSVVFDQPRLLYSYSPPNRGASHLNYFRNNANYPLNEQQGTSNGLITGEMSSRNQTEEPKSTKFAAKVPSEGNQTENITRDGEKMEKKKEGKMICHEKLKKINPSRNRNDDEEDGNGNPSSNATVG